MAGHQVFPASGSQNVEAQYVEMRVPLYSYGCDKKIKKALARFKGIYSVRVEYELQKVTVWGICDREAVLGAIRKKRREACFWNGPEYSDLRRPTSEVSGTTPVLAKMPRERRLLLWKRGKCRTD